MFKQNTVHFSEHVLLGSTQKLHVILIKNVIQNTLKQLNN
jgi:hypothetical protein